MDLWTILALSSYFERGNKIFVQKLITNIIKKMDMDGYWLSIRSDL